MVHCKFWLSSYSLKWQDCHFIKVKIFIHFQMLFIFKSAWFKRRPSYVYGSKIHNNMVPKTNIPIAKIIKLGFRIHTSIYKIKQHVVEFKFRFLYSISVWQICHFCHSFSLKILIFWVVYFFLFSFSVCMILFTLMVVL